MTEEDLHEVVDQLSEEDVVVLECLDQGIDEVHRITEATRLTVDQVNHRFNRKFPKLGLIEVERREGMMDEVVDGSRRVFQASKRGELTERGERVLGVLDEGRLEEYRSLSHDELADRVVELEDELEVLKRRFSLFREQVQSEIF